MNNDEESNLRIVIEKIEDVTGMVESADLQPRLKPRLSISRGMVYRGEL